MINALKLILDFFLKSKLIQGSIAVAIIIGALSLGAAIILQAKSGKCFTGIFAEVEKVIDEVK